MAARGAVPLSGAELVTALFFLCHDKQDAEVKRQALATLRGLPPSVLTPVVKDPQAHPQILDLVARVRLGDLGIMETLLINPQVSDQTLAHVAARSEGAVLSLVVHNDQRLAAAPQIVEAILSNPKADKALKFRFGWQDPDAQDQAPAEAGEGDEQHQSAPQENEAEEEAFEEEANLSKYQMALEMGVGERIKMALTGDKEWRTLLIKDSNKLVSSAVLKNPRITDGEVLMVAKNKGSNDELIRLITLNRDWVKNYEVKKALVLHARTPLPKALRYMGMLTEKDLKNIAKSRDVATVIVNNARRLVQAKESKR